MKDLFLHKMNERYAKEALTWTYEKPFDFYNNELTKESLQEMLDGSYYCVVDGQDEFVGFFCVGKSAQVPSGINHGVYEGDFIDFGLGMKPNLTGNGNGKVFCSFILDYVKNQYPGLPIRLTVASFNQRAIRLYEKLEFEKIGSFSGTIGEFFVMGRNFNN